jgi:hypothetical protein
MTFFQFEADFVESLRCVPMHVRLKLDTCGIKLKLSDWNHFTFEQRQALIDLPCDRPDEIIAYKEYLLNLIEDSPSLFIEVEPVWEDRDQIPPEVLQQAKSSEVCISATQWSSLSDLQRFVLTKLSRSHHENQNFVPAIQEFGLRE